MKKPAFQISKEDIEHIFSILKKIEKEKIKREVRIIGFDVLRTLVSSHEWKIIQRVRKIDPRKHGFKGPYFGIEKVPAQLVAIKNQKYTYKKSIKKIETQYLPRNVYRIYKKLQDALHRELGSRLFIESGYRSPAFQVILFLHYLQFYGFNFNKTVRRVAVPGYSEHCSPRNQAMDIITSRGIPSDTKPLDFSKTKEYAWLLEHAHEYGFHQSYPRNNKLGVMFEPWHWRC